VNKNEYVYIGIIGALLIHAVVLVVLNLTPMRAPAEAPVFVEVGFSTEEIEIDERTFEEVMAERVNEQIANLTADANSERSAERMNFSASDRAASDAEVENDLQNYEDEVQAELDAQREQAGETDLTDVPNDTKPIVENLDKYDYYGKSYNGSVTAEYDVPGREARKIDVPGYKCKAGGKVVVNVIVNKTGEVIEAEINQAASNITSSCLINEALASAKKSVFFIKSDAPKASPGSITYRFIPQ